MAGWAAHIRTEKRSVGEDRQPRTARGARPGLQVSHLAVTSAERSSRTITWKISMRGDREREREREAVSEIGSRGTARYMGRDGAEEL